MRPVKDPIHGWVVVEDYIADLVEMEQRNRGFGIDLEADRRAFSAIHRSLPPLANVKVQGAAKVVTVGDPIPMKPVSGIDLIDRMCEADAEREKVEGLRRRKL
jgi:hypothetical protein